MSPGVIWLISISAALIALAFIALVVFTIVMLFGIKKMLASSALLIERCNVVVTEVNHSIKSLHPLFNVVEHVGKVCERCVETDKVVEEKTENTSRLVVDALQWATLGVALFKRFKERR